MKTVPDPTVLWQVLHSALMRLQADSNVRVDLRDLIEKLQPAKETSDRDHDQRKDNWTGLLPGPGQKYDTDEERGIVR